LVNYFRRNEGHKDQEAELKTSLEMLEMREERLREDEARVKKAEERTKKVEKNMNCLIEQERDLMERIDRLEKEERQIDGNVEHHLGSIANCLKLIADSSAVLG
jgi:DNA repair ATPase RecN